MAALRSKKRPEAEAEKLGGLTWKKAATKQLFNMHMGRLFSGTGNGPKQRMGWEITLGHLGGVPETVQREGLEYICP